ncbi:MAG: tetratricopeptide repeat protein [Pyrinomonadaceae bacterium]|nr:tetratricopeptide repeat protein [Pyrinomonadaceae bacterium]
MKRCPQCRRDYYDDTLKFCLDDGSSLLEGPGSFSTLEHEAVTVPMHVLVTSEDATAQFTSPLLTAPPPLSSIAVLPFRNLSSGQEGDYFSDGLAEELLNVLSKIDGLRVAARTSAFSFKNASTTIAEIGRSLGVATVLEGSVRSAGERVRISVSLVKVSDGFQLWSETYDRTLDDIFAVQDDIAQSVVQELRGLLLGVEPENVSLKDVESDVAEAVRGRAADPEAYRLMLLGRYRLSIFTRENAEAAIDCYKRALDIDPAFALCWAELARAYSICAGKSWASTDEAFELSRAAVMRALELEPELAEAHAQLGRIQAAYDWDIKVAEASYDRALALAPGSSSVLDGASILAYKKGDFDRALALSRRVLDHDPLSAPVWHNLGLLCHCAGLLDEAEKAFNRSLEMPTSGVATSALLAMVLLDRGETERAKEIVAAESDEFWRDWALAMISYRDGNIAASDAALERLKSEATVGDAYQIAEVHAERKEADEAFAWLERAYEARDPGLTHAKVDPRFRNLKNDRRWHPLMESIGLGD